ncbi:MAG: PEP-CTERM sorting domain-containing protein [Verrucomicrobiales bacterium]
MIKLAFPFVLSLASVQATVVISDSFTGLGDGASLNGRTPETSLLGGNWQSATANLLGDGAGGVEATFNSTDSARTAGIDLGVGFLSANPGIYELSVDVFNPGASDSSWLALGFTQGMNVASNLVGNAGNPWMLYRYTGNVNVYGGGGVSNQRASEVPVATHGAATGTMHNLKLILDTSAAAWTLQAFIDNYEFDLNGGSAGTTYTFASNPTSARYVSFGNGTNGVTTAGGFDNFLLDFTPVPEPSVLVLLGGLGVGALRRRR